MFGPFPPRSLPEQDHAKLILLADRWQRSAAAQSKWSTQAKECVDFMEGRQWTEAQIAELASQKRPALRFNKIAPLVRLVLGYQENNRQDIRALPSIDSPDAEATAEAISRTLKHISENSSMPYVDTEVFLDGIITGRAYFDERLDYENNDLGEAVVKSRDPFAIYLDPDGYDYDLSKSGYLIEARYACIDEVRTTFGDQVADVVEPFTRGQTPLGPVTTLWLDGEITPVRMFGQKEDAWEWWDNLYTLLGDFADPLRRSIRVMDFQYWVTQRKRVFIDLETGDREVIPDHWGAAEIEKAMFYAEARSNPLAVDIRPVKQVWWTTIIGDTIVYDRQSQYKKPTITGFFPYFRRGMTRGMVEDLIDPQKEENKRRSAWIDAVMRVPHSGWKYHKDALTTKEKAKLKEYGSTAGYIMEWQGQTEPKKIEPSAPPVALERLEMKAEEDIRKISGINESALGELDKVQSGRAIEAKQRQAVISVQIYMTNFSRTKEIQGRKLVDIIQHHYTEERTFRILGEDGKLVSVILNKELIEPGTGVRSRLHDVTLGKYTISIDETPLSASFANAQFEEALMILEKLGPVGMALLQLRPDLLVEMSSLPRKEEWSQALQQAIGVASAPALPPGAPPGGGTPAQAGVAIDQVGGRGGPAQVQPTGNVIPLAR